MKDVAFNAKKRPSRLAAGDKAGKQVALIKSETTVVSTATETRTTSEPQFETEVRRRAETITVVLSEILAQRQGVQHWGLND